MTMLIVSLEAWNSFLGSSLGKVINLKPDEQAIIAVTATVIAELAVGSLFYSN